MILFIAVLLLAGVTAKATDQKKSDYQNKVIKRHTHTQPIAFVEKGIQFFVYLDGSIDYTISEKRHRSRNNWNSNTPGVSRDRTRYNRFVQYDYNGRLKKVGPNYITYDRYNRVRKIGSISIKHNRNGMVYQIGALHVFYNRYGKIRYTKGNVHYTDCGYCGAHRCIIVQTPYCNQNWKQKYDDDDDDDDDDDYRDRKRKKRSDDD